MMFQASERISARRNRLGQLLLGLVWGVLASVSASAQPTDDRVLMSGPAGQVLHSELVQAVQARVPEHDQRGFWLQRRAVESMLRNLYARQGMLHSAQAAGLQPDESLSDPQARERELVERYLSQQVQQDLPEETAVRAYARSEYRARPERFTEPEQLRVRHILLPVAADGKDEQQVLESAQALLGQLQQGADFADLARLHSADPGSARRGGELDWFGTGRMVPGFEKAAFALDQPGALSEPVRTQFGWHIIELQERKPASLKPFPQALDQVRQELLERHETTVRQGLWAAASADAQMDEAELTRSIQIQANLLADR